MALHDGGLFQNTSLVYEEACAKQNSQALRWYRVTTSRDMDATSLVMHQSTQPYYWARCYRMAAD